MRLLSCVFVCLSVLFSASSFALPTFNPQLVLKNQYGETSIMSPQTGSNYVANFKSTTVTLTAAQVIALNGTPITIVPAVSGSVIEVEAVEMAYVKGTNAFTVVASKHLTAQYATSNIAIGTVSTTGFIDQSTSKTAMVLSTSAGGVGITGQAVQITSDDSGMGSGTGSVVKVTVFYNLLTTI